jgi:nicotinamide-nucleotide amidase
MTAVLPKELIDKARAVVEANRKIGRRFALAESCTGGLVSAAITEIPGASDVFYGGIVSYSNEAKINRLKVGSDVIETFGAVSIATAWAMARGTLEASGADVAVAVTGIAGPDGGSPAKPVGTVVFAKAELGKPADDIEADSKLFPAEQGRSGIRLQAALAALDLLMP